MQKLFSASRSAKNVFAIAFAGIVLLAGSVAAQQTQSSASSTQTAPAAKSTKPSTTAPARKTQTSTAKPAGTALTTDKQKASYALGMNIGRGLSQQPVDLDVTTLLQGMRDALLKNKSQLTDDQIKAALAQLSSMANAKQQAASQAIGEANLKTGDEFLASNKTQQGVVTLSSGLQYKILTAGTGPKPTATDTVVCDYRGTLIDGKEFDSSYKRGQSATFPVNGVIKGWTEALQMMPVGSKWQLFIPPDLAYGSRSAGADIGPNSTLIFEVELHSIKGK
jgi:FKBP-type peptidyl-prolyl cis-trans isomerase